MSALEIIGISALPALLIMVVTWFMARHYITAQRLFYEQELRLKNMKIVTPTQLQAYERLTLVLERTKPESMLNRLTFVGLSKQQMQTLLMQTIRDEFEHNMSQQLYVSPKVWYLIKQARESLVQLINTLAEQLPEEVDALTFAKALVQVYAAQETTPTEQALEHLNQEVKQICA